MTRRAGCYGIIQYHPDIERAEGVNVGVVVCGFDPPEVRVVMSQDHGVLERRFPEHVFDAVRLDSAKQALAYRLRTTRFRDTRELDHFARGEAGQLVFVRVGSMAVEDIDEDATEFFARMVTP